MKVKIIYVSDKNLEVNLEKEINDFLATIPFDSHIFKIEHFCYGNMGWQTAVVYYQDFKKGE